MMHTRRDALLFAAAALAAGPASASSIGLRPTPARTEGPFYPDLLPAETDPDLVQVGQRQARGELLALSGRVLGVDGQPIPGAMIEIWQCDANGRYIASSDARRGGVDPGFQGFGRVKVGADGRYAFRTIKPVPYSGRTPHIHYKIYRPGGRVLTTQMMIDGEPLNDRDFVIRGLNPQDRAMVLAKLDRAGNGWRTQFDLVLA
jgi:protocatechuate 3,4-dioxygenase beta subunit